MNLYKTVENSIMGEAVQVTGELSKILAQRASLGRIASLTVNERLVDTIYNQTENLYYITPLNTGVHARERILLSGSAPFRGRPTGNGDNSNLIVPVLLLEWSIEPGRWILEQKAPDEEKWTKVNGDLTADAFIDVLRQWRDWDMEITNAFRERIQCSAQYLEESYAENRPCPTLGSNYVTWEQSIVEGSGHPLHLCRMPTDPKTQPVRGFDFKQASLGFMAVKRSILTVYGSIEAELQSLIALAGADRSNDIDVTETILPVHELQIPYLLSLPEASSSYRLLPHKLSARAQSSIRTMTVSGLPGIGLKLSLSVIIGNNVRSIPEDSSFRAVSFWKLGILDPTRVAGLDGTALEILPEVASANSLNGRLAVTVRWDPYHFSRGPVPPDVTYAVACALVEPAFIGQPQRVAEVVFGLTSPTLRLEFLRAYTRSYLACFLKPLFYNGLMFHAHGQNALVRYSRTTGQILGFSIRDMDRTRFNRQILERTTGINVGDRMGDRLDMGIPELLEWAYFVLFVNHLCPLVNALGLQRDGPAHITPQELLEERGQEKEAADLARSNGWAVVVRELHEALRVYEVINPGENGVSVTAQNLAAAARNIWLEGQCWKLPCFIAQRMRADWKHLGSRVSKAVI